ncbi:hypothetical protein Hanom_Chr11g01027581 [Helianthus anomalus]
MELDSVRAELEFVTRKYQQNEININKFDTSSQVVQNMCNMQLAYKENKGKGLGYNQVPPPYNHNYSRMPSTEQDLENEKNMMYVKLSDCVSWEPFKPKHARSIDFKKPMESTQSVANELVDDQTQKLNSFRCKKRPINVIL